jgi:O-antigen/teichoic acid export membrane protein
LSEVESIPAMASTENALGVQLKPLIYKLAFNRRFLSMIDQALISATNMCTSIIIGRTCPKAQLGLYASGLSLILLVTAIQSALVTVPYTISSPQIPSGEHALYKGSTILQQMILVSLGMLVFLCISLFGSARSNGDLRTILLTLALVSGIICFRDFARRVSYAELHFGFALVLDGILSLVQLLSIGLLAWRHQLTAGRALLAVGLASLSASLMWLIVNWQTISFSITHAMVGFRVNWALGRWLFGSSVLWSLCIDQYPWLITSLRAPLEAATWASAYGVMAFLNPIVLALNNDAAPRVSHEYARHGLAGLSRSVIRSSILAGIITSPVLLALLLFGSKLVRLMYGPKFGGAGLIVDLLALGLWFYAISLSFPYGMLALKRANVDFAINVACVSSFFVCGILLIRTQGVFGAACSFLIVQTVALVLRVALFLRIVRDAERRSPGDLAVGAAGCS